MSSVLLRLKKQAIVILGGEAIDPFRPCVISKSPAIDQLAANGTVEILLDEPGISDTEWARMYLAAGRDADAALASLRPQPEANVEAKVEAAPIAPKKSSKKG